MIGSKALGHATKIGLGNRRLVGKDKQAVVVAHLLRNGVEVARIYRCILRPGVHGQREVILHQRNVVLLGGLVQQGRGPRTVGTLQILKHNDRNL